MKKEWELTMTQREVKAIIEILATFEESVEVRAKSARVSMS